MSDERPTTDQPTPPTAQQPEGRPAEPEQAYDEGAPRTGPTARLWSLRTVAAAAITAVALSGAGGAALAAASEGGPADGPTGRPRFGGAPGGLDGQPPGQLPGRMQDGQDGPRPPRTDGAPGRLPSATPPGGRAT